VPFGSFVENTRNANSSDFLAHPGNKVKDAAAFEEMRQSILDRYQGVEVTHSFMAGGQHYDCIPINQQPAVRNFNISKIASAPPQELAGRPVTADGNVQPAQLDSEKPADEAGNSTQCGANTVPLLRTTLETTSRFATLQDFYRKSPSGAVNAAQAKAGEAAPKEEFVDPTVASHKYSFTYQYVNNLGGNANNNIWDPYVNTSLGEVFSLSQEWYVGGSGSGTQTEEVGWVVYPAMFNDERVHFFIFSAVTSSRLPTRDFWEPTSTPSAPPAELSGNSALRITSTRATGGSVTREPGLATIPARCIAVVKTPGTRS
jgi:hypothetical protein